MGFNPAVERFLVEWALDEFVVGHLLGVQTFHYGPDLEENIAVGSISQDELGHARMILRVLAEDEKELDRVVYTKPPEDMAVATLAEAWNDTDWSYLVVKSMLYDVADKVRFDFFARLPDERLRTIERMMGREEQVHREHWHEWIKILSSDAEGRRRLQRALDELYPFLADFFATDVYEGAATAYGVALTGRSWLLGQCLQRVKELFRPYPYTVPLADEQMIRQLEEPKGRAGRHLEVFKEIYSDIHSVYDLSPEMVWGVIQAEEGVSAVGVRQRQVTEADVLQVLKGVEDPEMPISIVDLGIVEEVAVGENGAVTLTLMPTFTGCPALGVIEKNVKNALRERLNVADAEVKWTFTGEWSTEKITEEGRMTLKAFGIAVAPKPGTVECPYCRSRNVVRESAFGCSLCREIYYCNDCKNPFEKVKSILIKKV